MSSVTNNRGVDDAKMTENNVCMKTGNGRKTVCAVRDILWYAGSVSAAWSLTTHGAPHCTCCMTPWMRQSSKIKDNAVIIIS